MPQVHAAHRVQMQKGAGCSLTRIRQHTYRWSLRQAGTEHAHARSTHPRILTPFMGVLHPCCWSGAVPCTGAPAVLLDSATAHGAGAAGWCTLPRDACNLPGRGSQRPVQHRPSWPATGDCTKWPRPRFCHRYRMVPIRFIEPARRCMVAAALRSVEALAIAPAARSRRTERRSTPVQPIEMDRDA